MIAMISYDKIFKYLNCIYNINLKSVFIIKIIEIRVPIREAYEI